MAEILSSNYLYEIDIFTSNAIDFRALRSIEGKMINKNDKYFNLVNNLRINRYPIEDKSTLHEKIEKINNIPQYRSLNLSDNCLISFLKNGPYLPDLIEDLLKSNNLNYQLIHTTFFPYFNLIISLIAGKIFNIPTVCTPFFHFSNPRYLDNNLIEILTKFDLLIACTPLEKQFLIDKCKIDDQKIKIIPMGVDIQKFEAKNEYSTSSFHFKEKFFKKKEKKYKMVLFCGYKNYEKGAISLLNSIPLILNKIKKVYFVFIGPSTLAYNREMSKIQKFKDVRIINLTPENLKGYFDDKKLAAFMETDVYCMPSRSDAFGIAFLEAWAAGKPVIGANIGATPDVIIDNIDGYLVEFDNISDIANKVILLLKKKQLRKKFGLSGKIKVSKYYTWELIANKTHLTYQGIIKNPNESGGEK